MATPFGYAEVIVLSQTGIQAAEQAFIEESACIVQASWFDASGNPYLPRSVNYQLSDVTSGEIILPFAYLAPAVVNTVTVNSAQNVMVNVSRESEAHQVLFQVTDQNGDIFYASVQFDIVRATGLN